MNVHSQSSVSMEGEINGRGLSRGKMMIHAFSHLAFYIQGSVYCGKVPGLPEANPWSIASCVAGLHLLPVNELHIEQQRGVGRDNSRDALGPVGVVR